MQLINSLLETINETFAAAIVVIAASMLLYNLTRHFRNRVARTSGMVLACVTAAYIADIFLSLEPGVEVYEATLRLQWIGIAFIPTALLHLSDALLATTGLPSRGRRKRIIRILYAISIGFFTLATTSNLLIEPIRSGARYSIQAGPLFWLYLIYFIIVNAVAVINVERARQRCLTRDTKRRMAYLEIAMLTPSLGIFPYSVLLHPGDEYSLIGLLLVNANNLIVMLMLIFLSYPLSFFGSRIPDRVVKVELLRFLTYGPGTGLLALGAITFTTQATRIFGLEGQDFAPFAVVGVVLLWQWTIALTLPWLEKRLIYSDVDDEQISKLQNLSDRLLLHSDLIQLVEATLAATCDYLRVNISFVVGITEDEYEVIKVVGTRHLTNDYFNQRKDSLGEILQQAMDDSLDSDHSFHLWEAYWITPLYSNRMDNGHNSGQTIIGFMGIEAKAEQFDLTSDEIEKLHTYIKHTQQTLDDINLQAEIVAALEGLLPQIRMTRLRAEEIEYRSSTVQRIPRSEPDYEDTVEQVRAALRHYWGGPGITRSRLLELSLVQQELEENADNAANALRNVLNRAIELQRPDGKRQLTSVEWTIYNLLHMRFIERMKVRDTAIRLSMSESDLYRKQRVAIEALTTTLLEMEKEVQAMAQTPS